MDARRIAFTGAQGVGKSTITVGVRNRLDDRYDVKVVAGIGTDVARLGLPIGSVANVATILTFATLHLQRERTATGELLVFDRCLLDLIAYARVTRCSVGLLGLLRECAAWSLPRFARLYYLPIEEFAKETSVDRENDEFRLQISEAIVDEAVAMGAEMVLVRGSVDERVTQVLRDLGL